MTKCKLVLKYLFLTLMSIFFVLPLYYMLCSASGGNTDVTVGLVIPGTQLWENISYILFETHFMDSFLYTLEYCGIQTVCTLLICSMAGYAFEIYHDRVKDRLFQVFLFALMIPLISTVVPLFIFFSRLHMQYSMTAVIAPFIASPLIVMIFRQNARSFPRELIEAARVDGLREVGIFFRIFIPNMKSTFSCAIIITFLNAWNSYQWPRIINYNEIRRPMSVYLTLSGKGNLMALVLLSMIPSLIVFFLFQKFFVDGMSGAVK